LAFKSTVSAKAMLDNGFTSVRDLGGRNFVNNSLRDAINNKTILGPRVMSAGEILGSTGGHADALNGMNKQ